MVDPQEMELSNRLLRAFGSGRRWAAYDGNGDC
jgi:hypothetical protein